MSIGARSDRTRADRVRNWCDDHGYASRESVSPRRRQETLVEPHRALQCTTADVVLGMCMCSGADPPSPNDTKIRRSRGRVSTITDLSCAPGTSPLFASPVVPRAHHSHRVPASMARGQPLRSLHSSSSARVPQAFPHSRHDNRRSPNARGTPQPPPPLLCLSLSPRAGPFFFLLCALSLVVDAPPLVFLLSRGTVVGHTVVQVHYSFLSKCS